MHQDFSKSTWISQFIYQFCILQNRPLSVGEGAKTIIYKGVLLPEDKRHTARCIASTHSAALSPRGGGGTGSVGWGRYPIQCWHGLYTHLVLMGVGTPIEFWWGGSFPIQSWAVPHPDLEGVPLSETGWGSPSPCRDGWGYPLSGSGWGYPSPSMGYPPERTWDQWMEVLWDRDGYPLLPGCEQTDTFENNTFPISF